MTMPTLLMQRAHDEAMGDDAPTCPTSLGGGASPPSTSWRSCDEYDACAGDGDKGALLRREGLYSSHIVEWRRARDAAALSRAWLGPGPSQGEPGRGGVGQGEPARSSGSRPSWPSTSWRWRSREKRTRSWRCLPRARRRPEHASRSRDRRLLRRAEAAGRAPPAPAGRRASPGPRTTGAASRPCSGRPAPAGRRRPTRCPTPRRRRACWRCCARHGSCDLAPAQVWAIAARRGHATWRRSPPCTGCCGHAARSANAAPRPPIRPGPAPS